MGFGAILQHTLVCINSPPKYGVHPRPIYLVEKKIVSQDVQSKERRIEQEKGQNN
jgi:hypothetical protein